MMSAGDELRVGVMRARCTWWRWLKCLLRGGHARPLIALPTGDFMCRRCGHEWADDGGII